MVSLRARSPVTVSSTSAICIGTNTANSSIVDGYSAPRNSEVVRCKERSASSADATSVTSQENRTASSISIDSSLGGWARSLIESFHRRRLVERELDGQGDARDVGDI